MRSSCFRLRAQFYHLPPFLRCLTCPGLPRQTWSSVSATYVCFGRLRMSSTPALAICAYLDLPVSVLTFPRLSRPSCACIGRSSRPSIWPAVDRTPSPSIARSGPSVLSAAACRLHGHRLLSFSGFSRTKSTVQVLFPTFRDRFTDTPSASHLYTTICINLRHDYHRYQPQPSPQLHLPHIYLFFFIYFIIL